MIYLKSFTILNREQEEKILGTIKETCYTTKYPFNIFRYRTMPQLEFEPLTIFYGGNGSGKTTLLNIIAERLHLSREAVFNRSNFFEDYVRFYHCQFIISTHSPFLLSMQGAKIYDLDSVPVDVKPWTQLENVKAYYNFFKNHEKEFS